jgi:hypothetical protein
VAPTVRPSAIPASTATAASSTASAAANVAVSLADASLASCGTAARQSYALPQLHG